MKKIILAANWKLNKSPNETREFFKSFLAAFVTNAHAEVVFFPSAISLEAASQSLRDSPIKFGAQNIYFESQGAFTGENSAAVVKELGGSYALIGHSERRQYFAESNELLGKKIQQALQAKLIPMLCIGETLAERESGKTESVLQSQLQEGLDLVTVPMSHLVVAYEPVWAIGTGKIATAEHIRDTHAYIHRTLKGKALEATPILYGGSVKAANAAELIQIPHVSGFLVGGASLDVASFLDLVAHSSLKNASQFRP